MQLLALATALITVAILLAILTTNENSELSLSSGVLASVSVVAFLLGFAPPRILRMWWRLPEQTRLQQAMATLLAFAESEEEVAQRVLEPAAAIVGASAMAIRNAEGRWHRIYSFGWLGLYDDPPTPRGDEVDRGLLERSGRRKPSYYAYRDG